MKFNNERTVDLLVHQEMMSNKFITKNFIIESEKSSDKNIQSLLQEASKNATNKVGKPDYILTPKKDGAIKNTVFIIENKNNINQRSKAIDESLWYSSFLSSNYNVFAIGITGNGKELIYDINYFTKGADGYKNIEKGYRGDFPNLTKLLTKVSVQNYHQTLDEVKLENISRSINKKIRDSLHVHEKKRPLFVSSILLCLIDKEFLSSYSQYYNEDINQYIYSTTLEILSDKGLGDEKINYIKTSLGFIKNINDSNHENITKEIIDTLRQEVISEFNAVKTDIVGYFYENFIKYSTSGGGDLGINLTPTHIVELMYRLSKANTNSKIFDPTMGTGSFLSFHWKKIFNELNEKNNNNELLKERSKNSVIGIELDDDMYTLAVMNMILHNDGLNNLYKGSCFNKEIQKRVKTNRPDVALSNPPYGVRTNNELEFTLTTLDALKVGGIGVFIFPISVVRDSPDLNNIKEIILDNHKLIASIEVPKDIFLTASVQTAIFVFEAHKKHDFKNDDVWFAKFEDGYKTYNKGGRKPISSKNSEEKLQNFINLYNSKSASEDVSFISKIKSHKDHFVFSGMNEKKFDKNEILKNYFEKKGEKYIQELKENNYNPQNVSWQVSNSLFDISKNINFSLFKLTDYFNIRRGKRWTIRQRENSSGEFPFITATNENNGISKMVNKKDVPIVFEGGCITVNVFGKSFVQKMDFSADDNVRILEPKSKMSLEQLEFISSSIDQLTKYYSYGHKWQNETVVKNTEILLPTKGDKVSFEDINKIINNSIKK